MRTSTPKRRQRHLTIILVLVAAIAVYHTVLMLVQSVKPGYYYESSVLHREFSFPYLAVCVSIALLLGEAMLLTFVLTRPITWLWLRGLFCLVVLLPCVCFGILSAMHMPPYYSVHVLGLFRAALFVLIVVIASAAVSLYRRCRGRSALTNQAPQATAAVPPIL
jgi:hypothetical protein